ncbi:hypothetical protein LY474_11720 [Myxococcus stipitatus]|uniref:hypothetical protein n=1 Tax=Myxococcus stipitatus TaxID=83455 RepID=UPI001F38906E|nr:hypothetical protein [Myxococcus stipitatus]MCE9668480.1 hypothetical protein [Myxococcus stipitatus]
MKDPNPARPPSLSSENAERAGRKASVWSGVGLVVALAAGGALYFRVGRQVPVKVSEQAPRGDQRSSVDVAKQAPPVQKRFRHWSKEARLASYSGNGAAMRFLETAARATHQGHGKEARAALDEVFRWYPGCPPALLLKVCLALAEGRDASASAALEELDEKVLVRSPEIDLLEALRQRRREPGTSPLTSFRDAWTKLGRPDFRESGLLPGATLPEIDPKGDLWRWNAWRDVASDEVRRLVVLSMSEPNETQALFLLQQFPRLEDPHDVLAAMDTLRGEVLPESVRATARRTFHEKLVALAAAHPTSMRIQLQRVLGNIPPEQPLRAADLAALERVAALPAWRETSFEEHYRRTRELLKDVTMPDLPATAWEVASRGLREDGTRLLRERLLGDGRPQSSAQRKRLGRVAHAIGAAMARQTTRVERMTGLRLMVDGADAMGDEDGRARALARLRELDDALLQFQKTALERWPLPALAEELLAKRLEDEPALILSFAEEDA